MPTKSPAQKRLMQAAAHTKGGFGGVPQKVGKEFVFADKRLNKGNTVKKVKKMADGGLSSLGSMIPGTSTAAGAIGKVFGGGSNDGGGGGSATDGLSTVNQGAQSIGSALSRASAAIGGGGGGGGGGSTDDVFPSGPYTYKKGGHVTTRRVSTGSTSKKSPNW